MSDIIKNIESVSSSLISKLDAFSQKVQDIETTLIKNRLKMPFRSLLSDPKEEQKVYLAWEADDHKKSTRERKFRIFFIITDKDGNEEKKIFTETKIEKRIAYMKHLDSFIADLLSHLTNIEKQIPEIDHEISQPIKE